MMKYMLTCVPVICAAMSPLSADVARTNQQASKQQQMQYQSQSVNSTEITPPAPPLVRRNSADPFASVEYIYWKAEEEGLDYAVNGISTSQTTTVSGRGKVHHPHFDYDSGFKVGFGLKFKHDSWDLYANYTWLHSDNKHSTTQSTAGQSLQTLWYTAYDNVQEVLSADTASSKWKMQFSALDVELGRNYFISRRLTLRPHFGLKFAWIDQQNHVDYANVSGVNLAPDAVNDMHNHLKQDKFGVGIRTGLNTAWFMWNKWSIFGNFAASALYSDFDNHQKMTLQDDTNGKRTLMDLKHHHHDVTPVLEFALGLRFETDFVNNNYQFMIQAGWEEQIWFNENQFSNLADDRTGNLTVQGLTVKVGFAF